MTGTSPALSYSDDLGKLKRLIRVGLPLSELPSDPTRAEKMLQSAILTLITSLEAQSALAGNEADYLQYLALKAEFHFNFGRRDNRPLEKLAQYIDHKGLRVRLVEWHLQSRPKSQGGANQPHFRYQEERNPRLLRQKVWALMAIAFYYDHHYGKAKGALDTLLRLEKLVDEELVPPLSNQRPYGTKARLHYFIGQCLRSEGNFRSAENRFLLAQKHADLRLRRELNQAISQTPSRQRTEKIQYEYQFGVICTARILASLGRSAMLQGKLDRSLKQFYAARTLLVTSGQEPLKMVVDSHIAISEQRLAPRGTRAWKDGLEKLAAWHKTFTTLDDVDGIRRCAQELAQTYLQEAESLDKSSRQVALGKADTWIEALAGSVNPDNEYSQNKPERLTSEVLRAWWWLLHEKPGLTQANECITKAKKLEPKETSHRVDFAGFDKVHPKAVEGMYHALNNVENRERGGQNFVRASRFFLNLMEEAKRGHDPVLESEALLRMSSAEIDEGRPGIAQRHLQQWRLRGPFVENQSHQVLFNCALRRIAKPRWEFPASSFDLDKELEEVKKYLCDWALKRYATVREAEDHLNLKPGRLSDMKKHWAEQDAQSQKQGPPEQTLK